MDLKDAAKFEGELDKCRSESGECETKTVEIGGDGFEGQYGAPKLVDDIIKRRRLMGTHNVTDHQLAVHSRRSLQDTAVTKKIFNPVYCIKQHDKFIFTIDSPTHFPVYMKNSVMNTNEIFDYG